MIVAASDFKFLQDFVFDRSAIVLAEDKEYLVESRLQPIARDFGFTTVAEVLRAVRYAADPAIELRVIDALTTNETSWFRDLHPFDALRETILPERIARNAADRRLAIWSAASSSGQELYSVAMLIDSEFPELAGWTVDLLGTDLSSEVVQRAREGRYSGLEMNRGLPATKLVRYFVKDGTHHRICDAIRSRVRFEHLNLAKPWPPLGRFDVILLRNVLIYFDPDTKRRIVEAARCQLASGGYLILGSAETALGLVDGLVPVATSGTTVYRLEGA